MSYGPHDQREAEKVNIYLQDIFEISKGQKETIRGP